MTNGENHAGRRALDSLKRLLMRVLSASERRTSQRRSVPGLTAYYWEGGAPKPHRMRDVSQAGAFLEGGDLLYPGTVMNVTLQCEPHEGLEPAPIVVRAKVVHQTREGAGLRFVYLTEQEEQECEHFLSRAAAVAGIRSESERGQSLIEFALILPLMILLIVNVINFAGMFMAWITIANAARSGTQYMIMGGATVGAPPRPANAKVVELVTQDASLLPNIASLKVRVCTNNNGTILCTGTGSGTIPADPEAPSYVTGSVDVTYTYLPFIPLWNFPSLGIYSTLPPTTIHRQARMRVMQ